MNFVISAAKAVSDAALIVALTEPKYLGQIVRPQGHSGDDAECPAAPSFEGPEQVGIAARVHDSNRAVGGHDLRFQKAGRRGAVSLRERSEAAALDETGNANGSAAASLNVAAAPGGHRVVDIHPHRTGLDRDCGRRRHASCALCWHVAIVQSDRSHLPSPHEKGVGSVRRALITMSTAFYDEPEIVIAREPNCCRHVGRAAGDDRVCARLWLPRVQPPGDLRAGRVVAKRVGIAERLPPFQASRSRAVGLAWLEKPSGLDQGSFELPRERGPRFAARPTGIPWTDAITKRRRRDCGGHSPEWK